MNNNNPAVAVATATATATTASDTVGSTNTFMSIESSDIIRLIHAHLIESGLHNTAQTLRAESGVGSAGINANIHSNLFTWCKNGQWGEVLESLSTVDARKLHTVRGGGRIPPRSLQPQRLMADIHELSILELADAGEYDLARAILRVVADELDDVPLSSNDTMEVASSLSTTLDAAAAAAAATATAGSRSASIERRIQALITLRSPGMDVTASTATTAAAAVAQGRQDDGGTTAQQMLLLIPPDYYGENNISKQKRREEIGRELVECIPIVPHSRLLSLLQQAVKWQAYTGQLPMIRECWDDDDDDDNEEESKNESSTSEEDETSSSTHASDGSNKEKKKKKKRKKHKKKKKKKQKKQKHGRKKKIFDLVLGEVADASVDSAHSGDRDEKRDARKSPSSSSSSSARKYEKIPARPYAEIKFGKRSHVEIAAFLPDGTGLITGSSDGFIEIWGEKKKNKQKEEEEEDSQFDYTQLRTSDLPHQRNDEALLVHEDNTSVVAIAVSNDGTMIGSGSTDGTVKIWKFTDGKCLRQFHRAVEGSVSCLQFGPDGSRILVSGGFKDGICREFGLRTSKMLKEFRGHDSYVNVCAYVLLLRGGGGSSSGSGGGGASGQTLLVVTGSADGTVRVWDGRTSEVRRVIRPSMSPTDSGIVGGVGVVGTAVVGSGADDIGSTAVGRSVHTVLPLHSPADTMIVVPRETRAYLMTYGGAIIRVYERDDVSGDRKGNFDFVAATVSPTNKWLYVAAEDGVCCCFNVGTGKLEKIIRNFAEESAGGAGGGSGKIPEVTGLAHHPHKGILASYSNDKGQKRGILTLWK